MIVADSSPIIILAKQGMLNLLEKCFQKVSIPKSVYEEVMRKKESIEAITLKNAVEDKWLSVEKADIIPMLETKNMGIGEKEAISLAHRHKSLLIIDDDSAKKYALIFGVKAHGTIFVIYSACAKKLVDEKDAARILEGMVSDGFYISAEVYAKFSELLRSLKDR